MPQHLHLLAEMERNRTEIETIKELTAPMILEGLEILEAKFGGLSKIDNAREKILAYLATKD